ncbi:hypothetical protein [Microbacterium testaceum]|jgi:hypothetical protein|uniref:hypothetical protein n=1 Tax=Microbacterium testaceum TaxID=2033 RepID=UPI001D1732CE|nr:hypothetical protein [Microbacterium testaceum]MCC4248255.1 hypothetical protein [Microbacterium testaceum]
MAQRRMRTRNFAWLIAGGAVLAAAVILAVTIAITPREGAAPAPEPSGSSTPTATTPAPTASNASVVDASVTELGWVPEPITADEEVYLRAAIEAAGTVDTTRATREEWVTYLDTWFTPDPRYTDPEEQAAQVTRYQQEMREAVVFPDAVWASLEDEDGRVVAITVGEMSYTPVPDYAGDDMFIGTSDVILTFTEEGEDSAEHSYEEQVRVSAQVLCGDASVPTPGSTQAPGDCMLIRFFDSALGD